MELKEIREHAGVDVKHYLFLDAHYTWWDCGKSYLCRIIDMLHMGYVDEVLFGYEVVEELPRHCSPVDCAGKKTRPRAVMTGPTRNDGYHAPTSHLRRHPAPRALPAGRSNPGKGTGADRLHQGLLGQGRLLRRTLSRTCRWCRASCCARPPCSRGAILLSQLLDRTGGKLPVVTRINDVRFKRIVRPGETIRIEVDLVERLADAFFLKAKATVDGKVAVRFEFACTAAAIDAAT